MYRSLIPLCEYIPIIYEHHFFSPLVRPLTHTTIVVRPNYNSFHITHTWRCEKIFLWVGTHRKFTPSRNSNSPFWSLAGPADDTGDTPAGQCLSTPDKHHLLWHLLLSHPVTLSNRMETLFSYSLKYRSFLLKIQRNSKKKICKENESTREINNAL